MKHNEQILVFLLFILLGTMIYKTSAKPKRPVFPYDPSYKYSRLPSKIEGFTMGDMGVQDPNYMKWRNHWTGRNVEVKECYNVCQGLYDDQYRCCSDSCKLQDTFGKK